MEKILIATKNKDKYEMVKGIISKIYPSKYKFYSLYDIKDLKYDDKEEGTIEERAYNKANQIYLNLKENNFKYIIGIDDGLKMKEVLIKNVKDFLEDIVNGDYLKKDELVEIVKAYAFINQKGEYKIITTAIPFKYKKLDYVMKLKENSYPLSYVFKPLNSNKTISEMTDEESNEYYVKYSEGEFKKIL